MLCVKAVEFHIAFILVQETLCDMSIHFPDDIHELNVSSNFHGIDVQDCSLTRYYSIISY